MTPAQFETTRRRIVHHLIRRFLVKSEDGAVEHLSTDELAAFLGGRLFESETVRLENHLLSCVRCRELATHLHVEFEAGVVPHFMRRTGEIPISHVVADPLPRRMTPWLLGVLVFAALALVPVSISLFSGGGQKVTDGFCWVLGRVGTPVYLGSGREHSQPARVGAVLRPATQLTLESGDALLLLSADGSIRRETRDGSELINTAEKVFADLHTGLIADLDDVESGKLMRAGPEPSFSAAGLRVLHPRGRILDSDPEIRWQDDTAAKAYRVVVVRLRTGEVRLDTECDRRRLRFPRNVRPLERGEDFEIRLETIPRDRPTPLIHMFQVTDQMRATQLEEALRGFDRWMGRRAPLLRGEYLRQQGLLSDALLAFEEVIRDDTSNVEVLSRICWIQVRLGLAREAHQTVKLIEKQGGD